MDTRPKNLTKISWIWIPKNAKGETPTDTILAPIFRLEIFLQTHSANPFLCVPIKLNSASSIGRTGKEKWCLFFFLIFFFILFIFNLTIMYWFCHISKWIRHRYTCVPHPEPSSLLPPPTIPLGRPSAPAASIQYRASNLKWCLYRVSLLRLSGVGSSLVSVYYITAWM